jgi:8-oxo-dGTP diphosphatase
MQIAFFNRIKHHFSMVNDDAYERPILTVDIVLLMLAPDTLRVGLLKRAAAPFVGELALPGGYVHTDGDADTLATARRVLKVKCGLSRVFCEQLQTFSGPKRDPRGWSATVAYYALLPEHLASAALRQEMVFKPVSGHGRLPFDHAKIVAAAVERLRGKGSYSTLPAFLLGPTFTLSELRSVYERVMETQLNDSAFRRKIDELRILEPVEGEVSKRTARPAQLFRLRDETLQAFDRKI